MTPPTSPRLRALTCERCGAAYTSRKRTRYCGKSCAAKARWEDPGWRAAATAAMGPRSSKQRTVASARMHRLNRDPAIRAQQAAALRGRTFQGQRGGNGQLTPEQRLLQRVTGWTIEYAIATGERSWPCAMVDLAYPRLKIAIECDGASHRSRKQRNRDARKAAMLSRLGWTVLRFWNAQITGDLDAVLAAVARAVQARS